MWVIQSVSCHLSKKWLSQTRMSLIVTNFENVDTVWRVTKTWRILCQKPFWLCKRIVSYHIASSDKSKKRCEDESVSWELFLSQSETEKQWKKLSLRVTGCLAVVFFRSRWCWKVSQMSDHLPKFNVSFDHQKALLSNRCCCSRKTIFPKFSRQAFSLSHFFNLSSNRACGQSSPPWT